jgi:hypothetical protein
VDDLRFFTPEEYRQIERGWSERPRAAARHGLTSEQVKRIRSMQASYENICVELYPGGTLLRLDEPMSGEARSPKVGTIGVVREITTLGKEKVQIWVDWPEPLPLAVIWPTDEFTLLRGSGESES